MFQLAFLYNLFTLSKRTKWTKRLSLDVSNEMKSTEIYLGRFLIDDTIKLKKRFFTLSIQPESVKITFFASLFSDYFDEISCPICNHLVKPGSGLTSHQRISKLCMEKAATYTSQENLNSTNITARKSNSNQKQNINYYLGENYWNFQFCRFPIFKFCYLSI